MFFSTISLNASAGLVAKNQIRSFAAKFACSNPNLQWQFDNLTTLFDQNEWMANRSSRAKSSFIFKAADLGGNGEWLYRGVTNQQFNESQILALIFNDEVAVSESRWFSGHMFSSAHVPDGQYVAQREQFRNLTANVKRAAFRSAYLNIKDKIAELLARPAHGGNAYSEHVRIGSSFNGTPQSIQFLTPHLDYAESYGEFVLHIHEVIQRGIDVERYNYHNPEWSYRIGSIYRADRDEYEVPSHIPGWDVQMIKVRNGTGWHRGSYGPPIYYYTKLFEPENPCNVTGVRVDAPSAEGGDDQRRPVGVIVMCPTLEKCPSDWNGALGANEARLKTVVEATKIDEFPLAFLPIEKYVLKQRSDLWLLGQPLSVVKIYAAHVSKENIDNPLFWGKIFAANAWNEPKDGLEIFNTLSASTREIIISKLSKKEVSKSQYLDVRNLQDYLAWIEALGWIRTPELLVAFEHALTNWKVREPLYEGLTTVSKAKPSLKILSDNISAIKVGLDRSSDPRKLKPSAALKALSLEPLENSKLWSTGRPTILALEILARGIQTEPEILKNLWASTNIHNLSETDRLLWLEELFSHLQNNEAAFNISSPFELWANIGAQIPTDLRGHLFGVVLDWAMHTGRFSAVMIAKKMGAYGLPKEREIDVLRNIWQLSKLEDAAPAGIPGWEKSNSYWLFTRGLEELILKPQIISINANAEITADEKEKQLENLRLVHAVFATEAMNPVQPFLGFAGLSQLVMLLKQPSLYLWPLDRDKKITIKLGTDSNGQIQTYTAKQYKSILSQSLSFFLLSNVYTISMNDKQSDLRAQANETLKHLIRGYIDYALGSFSDDLKSPFLRRLIRERKEWNSLDDTAGLLTFLSTLESDPDRAQKLRVLGIQVSAYIPGTSSENPWKDYTMLWKDILK